MQELKECTFKPTLDEVSELLANKKRRSIGRIENNLLEDAVKRFNYKEKIKETVSYYTNSRLKKKLKRKH